MSSNRPSVIQHRGIRHLGPRKSVDSRDSRFCARGSGCPWCARTASAHSYTDDTLGASELPASGRGVLPNGQFPDRIQGTDPGTWNGPFMRHITRKERPLRNPDGTLMVGPDGVVCTEPIPPVQSHDTAILARLRERHPGYYEVYVAWLEDEEYADIADRLCISVDNARHRKHRAERVIQDLIDANFALHAQQRHEPAIPVFGSNTPETGMAA